MAHMTKRPTVASSVSVAVFAGCVATVPQTLAMAAVRRWLPGPTRGRFPPRQVTEAIVTRVIGRRRWSEPVWWTLTAASHFAFGSAAGAAYPLVPAVGPVVVHGAAFGLAVGAVPYLVVFPLLGIRSPQGDRPVRKAAQLVAAHVAWGIATAVVYDRLRSRRRSTLPAGPRTMRDDARDALPAAADRPVEH